MSKLTFPGIGKPNRGFISDIRVWFQRIASYAEKSPKAKPELLEQITPLISDLGGSLVPDGGVSLPDGGTATNVRTAVGTDPHSGFIQVVDGAIDGVNLVGTVALVDSGDTISVRNFAGANGVNGTAQVTGTGTVSGVNLPTQNIVKANASVTPIKNSTGTITVNGTYGVSATQVDQGASLPATATIVQNGVALTVPVTGTYTTTVTPVVANGVITSIALS